MARIELDEESITVRLQGLERLWALRTRVTADRSAVRAATASDVMTQVRGLRAPGLGLPELGIGTWRSPQGRDRAEGLVAALSTNRSSPRPP